MRTACGVMDVSTSGYYAWKSRGDSPRAQLQKQLFAAVAASHARSKGVYGYRKVHQDIDDFTVCPETVRRAMKAQGLRSRVIRRFRHAIPAEKAAPVLKNVLDREFTASQPNQKWVGDITYIPTQSGWLYLSVVLDLYSRRVIGWAMSDKADAVIACRALECAINARKPTDNLIHHSDQGAQYTSSKFSELLTKHSIQGSMSRKGNCWDNAVAESFFGKLKAEWVKGKTYKTHDEARLDLFYYLEVFYNRHRRHATLGYLSPASFEKRHAGEAQL